MNEVYDFLKNRTQVNYVATINGDKPSLRPFGDPFTYEGKIYCLTNAQKNVAKQIAINNNVCIVACDGEEWIRINCKLINDSDNIAAKKACIKEFPWTEEAGYTLDNPDFQIYYMDQIKTTIANSEGQILAKYEI